MATVDQMFMSRAEIYECIKTIKIKNNEDYDRISQRVLVDAIDVLIDAFTNLFALIYAEKKIPEQWKFAKIIPIHKKGPKI